MLPVARQGEFVAGIPGARPPREPQCRRVEVSRRYPAGSSISRSIKMPVLAELFQSIWLSGFPWLVRADTPELGRAGDEQAVAAPVPAETDVRVDRAGAEMNQAGVDRDRERIAHPTRGADQPQGNPPPGVGWEATGGLLAPLPGGSSQHAFSTRPPDSPPPARGLGR